MERRVVKTVSYQLQLFKPQYSVKMLESIDRHLIPSLYLIIIIYNFYFTLEMEYCVKIFINQSAIFNLIVELCF